MAGYRSGRFDAINGNIQLGPILRRRGTLVTRVQSSGRTGVEVQIDEPISKAMELFMANRILDAHWTQALDRPWRVGVSIPGYCPRA